MTGATKTQIWIGWILTVLVAAMMLMSGVMKILKPDPVSEGFPKMGWDIGLAMPLAIVEIAAALCFLLPPTAVLGAVLLTGYLGGAIATHVRVGDQFLIPVALGVVVWLAIYLRDARLRPLLPFRS